MRVDLNALRALLVMCKWAAIPVLLLAVVSIPFGGPDLRAVGGALAIVIAFAATFWLYGMLFDLICVTIKFIAKWTWALLRGAVVSVAFRGKVDG